MLLEISLMLEPSLLQRWAIAADGGDVQTAREMLADHPELLDARFNHATLRLATALHLSAWSNRPAVAELLLDAGADLEARDATEMTPLQVELLRVGLEEMRAVPLQRSQSLDFRSPPAVSAARFKRRARADRSSYRDMDTTMLDLLLDRGADVNCRCHHAAPQIGGSLLLLATEYGLIKHVEKLLDHGADTLVHDKNGRTALDVAGENGFTDIIERLLAAGPSELLQLHGEETIRMAIRHDNVSVLDMLFDKFMDTMPVERSSNESNKQQLLGDLLLLAVEYDTFECVRFLLDYSAPMDWIPSNSQETNSEPRPAVHLACAYGRPDILRFLLERGANAQFQLPRSGFSPYHSAAMCLGDSEIAVLGDFGANPSLLDKDGCSPLVLAARSHHSKRIMEALVAHGGHFILPTVARRDEMTPLLASWLYKTKPSAIPTLVEAVVEVGCIADPHHRRLLSALVWGAYMEEAVFVLLLMLISSDLGRAEQAAQAMKAWARREGATSVVCTLLFDVLLA